MAQVFRCGRFSFSADRPLIMGIVNVTSDSFSHDGYGTQTEKALARCLCLLDQGADILDIGGESTRPGSLSVSVDEELRRVMPLIEALARYDCPVSIDTSKPEVMREALRAGASMINDVNALQNPLALEVVSASHCGLCLMHKQGWPVNMQMNPKYVDIIVEVGDFFAERYHACIAIGIDAARILFDPGFGFGKTLAHNVTLFQHLGAYASQGWPLLVGVSRKSMLGELTGRPVAERMMSSVVANLLAVQSGVRVVRVHDVFEMKEALKIMEALVPVII